MLIEKAKDMGPKGIKAEYDKFTIEKPKSSRFTVGFGPPLLAFT
jgi:hypothetical protein